MKLYQIETTPDTAHDLDWLHHEVVRRYRNKDLEAVPPPAKSTIWRDEEFHLTAVAEDGLWVKLCGPNANKLQGKPIRVTVEDAEEPGVQGIRDRAPEVVTEYVEKWKRSRSRDGDDEWCKAMRHGWAQVIAALLGQPFRIVNKALERGEL